MKRLLFAILSGAFMFLVCYLFGAFSVNSFDLGKWTQGARMGIGALGLVLGILAAVISYYKLDTE